jgi:hypothetical protein
MSQPASTPEVYRDQLARWVGAFATARFDDLAGDVDDQSSTDGVRRFLINGYSNRMSWLLRETAFAGEAFADYPALVRTYIHTVPRTTYDPAGIPDEEQFVRWLEETQPLTDRQLDFVTCQLGELAVFSAARRDRPGHVAFQHLWRRWRGQADRLTIEAGLRIHLNPIRFEARLLTGAIAGEGRALPAPVVFFPVGTDVHTAFLEPAAMDALHDLARRGPCTLGEWGGAAAERISLARALAEQGLAAVE